MPDLVRIQRALISVSDKTEVVTFARALHARGVEIISTGGTARALSTHGVPVTPVEVVTGFPEGLDGRVKTLHPGIHAGLLARRDHPDDAAFLDRHKIRPIDLVCINLYPFQQTITNPDATLEEAIEQIDVGGPAMLRAAAKNHAFLTVVTSPSTYDRIIRELDQTGCCTSLATRSDLAAAAFSRTAEYDAAIANFLARRRGLRFPPVLQLGYTLADELRYGENPHQLGALYRDPTAAGPSVVSARQLHGKQLSYNNLNDAAAALEACRAVRLAANEPAIAGLLAGFGFTPRSTHVAVVVKHTNPCGGALTHTPADAVRLAIAGDSAAAFGGILAVSGVIDESTASVIAADSHFFEVIIAPGFSPEALGTLARRWTQVRLLETTGDGPAPATSPRPLEFRSVPGGLLAQDRDVAPPDPSGWQHRAGPAPTPAQVAAAAVLETLCRAVTSNAVVVGGWDPPAGTGTGAPAVRLFGIGSGQVDRVSACRLAVAKAGPNAAGAIAVGDAFFPFDDGPRVLIDAGVTCLVHPGGSKRDDDTFALCRERGVTCLTTGVRHFRH